MDFRLSKKAKDWLRLYIEGESENSIPEDVRQELLPYSSRTPIEVFRGNYFESRQHAEDRYMTTDLKLIAYNVRSPKSFSRSQEVAEIFAQDINSNYGIVLRLTIDMAYLDLSSLPEELTEDFDHEQEILVLEDSVVEAVVVKEYKDVKKKLGLS